ncbi:MAG: pilus assembly protein [Chloroflexota bacterium]|nr:pilus assembly protein [Chloroflexota bacterium]MDE3193878.1 pilus assembly protein [Chloroflexota bacterium]
MVELALALPVLAFTLLGGADMARAYSAQLAVQNSARAGAEAAGLIASPSGPTVASRAQTELTNTPGVSASGSCSQSGNVYTCGGATITVSFTRSDGSSACTGAASTSVVGTSTSGTPCYAKVEVRYTFTTLTPWPGLPHSFTFDRMTMYRRYQCPTSGCS